MDSPLPSAPLPAMSEAVLAAIKRGCFLIALRMRPSGRAVFTTATELLFAKANLPTFPQPFMPRMQKFFRLGCKIVHAKHAYLGYSSIAAGGGCGVNAMFTFTIEGCVVVVNGRFVKEEPLSLLLSFSLDRRSSRCLLSREKSVASYRNAPLSATTLASRP